MLIVRGRHFLLGETFDFVCEDGVIQDIRQPGDGPADLGSAANWVTPGLLDIQINGYAGVDFCSEALRPEQVEAASQALAEAGVTGFCPTVITNSPQAIEASMAAIAAACEAGGAARERILGIHLEGPFISPETGPRGAHPVEHVTLPDWEQFSRWQAAAGGRIRLVTLAPELRGSLDFIRRACAAGLVVALGHHAATRGQIDAAVAAGASMSTHLGNGSHAMLPRHANYIWEQIANDALEASIIVDGFHLPPAVVKTFFRTKGTGRLILVTDVIWLAGMAPGRYRFAGIEVDLRPDGSVRLADTGYLGGSTLKLVEALNNVMAFAGASLAEAVQMAAANPARLMGAADRGRLAPGARADLLLLEPKPNGGNALAATIAGGRVCWRAG